MPLDKAHLQRLPTSHSQVSFNVLTIFFASFTLTNHFTASSSAFFQNVLCIGCNIFSFANLLTIGNAGIAPPIAHHTANSQDVGNLCSDCAVYNHCDQAHSKAHTAILPAVPIDHILPTVPAITGIFDIADHAVATLAISPISFGAL